MTAACAKSFASIPTPMRPERAPGAHPELPSLLQAIATGDQASFARFYDLTCQATFGLVLRIVRDRGLAEEVSHDVYLQIWRQADRYSADRGTPLAWTLTIARSRAIDRVRRSRHQLYEVEFPDSSFELAAPDESPESASLSTERRHLIRHALRTLSFEQRQVIAMAYFGGLTQSEIALRLGLPLGTVKTRLRIGLIRLRQAIEKNEAG